MKDDVFARVILVCFVIGLGGLLLKKSMEGPAATLRQMDRSVQAEPGDERIQVDPYYFTEESGGSVEEPGLLPVTVVDGSGEDVVLSGYLELVEEPEPPVISSDALAPDVDPVAMARPAVAPLPEPVAAPEEKKLVGRIFRKSNSQTRSPPRSSAASSRYSASRKDC